MKKLILLTLLSTLLSSISFAGQTIYSAANNITFTNSKENKPFVGNGFLINHNDKIYAVTAKHVLFEIQKSGVKTIDIKGYFDNWSLKPFNSESGVVILGTLLNAKPTEKLDMAVLQNDWLVFEVKANNSSLKALKFASEDLKAGQSISAHGCTYSNQKDCKQNKYSGKYVKSQDNNLLIKLNILPEEMNTLRGLSGAPVLNSKYEVVGIVSNIIPDKETGSVYFAPFTIQPLLKFLNKINS